MKNGLFSPTLLAPWETSVLHKSRRLILLLTASLLAPYLLMLVALWSSESKDSAASGLAFAGAVVLGWHKRSSLAGGSPGRKGLGMTGVFLATLCYTGSVILDFRVGVGIFAPAILLSLVYLFRGRHATVALRLPILLLILATPVPGFVMNEITYALLDFLVVVMSGILAWLHIQVSVDGYTLVGSDWGVQIVEDCSGLGGILLFVPLAILLLYAHPRVPPLGYAAVLAASLPIAFFGSVLRVLVSCLLGEMGSSLFSSDLFHQIAGLVTLLLGIVLLILLCRFATPTLRRPLPREAMA